MLRKVIRLMAGIKKRFSCSQFPRNLIYNLLTLENEGRKFLQNTGVHLPCDRGSDLRRRESSYLIYFPYQ
jgi:hypothetical protein